MIQYTDNLGTLHLPEAHSACSWLRTEEVYFEALPIKNGNFREVSLYIKRNELPGFQTGPSFRNVKPRWLSWVNPLWEK